jgi:hypothetical protein
VIAPSSYKKVLSALHTSATRTAINSFANNRVLGAKPPEVNIRDRELPQIHRSTLCQLRSSYCKGIEDFEHFIGITEDYRCAQCNFLPHTTFHLFHCTGKPTDLTPWALRKHPRETVPSFSYFSPVPPPLPEPPPAGIGGPPAPRYAGSRRRPLTRVRARSNSS